MADNVDQPYSLPDEKYSKEDRIVVNGKQRDPQNPEERKLVRRLDKRILPITCLLYLFACECLKSLSSTVIT